MDGDAATELMREVRPGEEFNSSSIPSIKQAPLLQVHQQFVP